MSDDNTQVTVETTVNETVDTQETPVEQHAQKQERTFTREDISKMISAEKAKWENEQNEAKKLAKMNADEKQRYQAEQKEAELAEREALLVKKEMTAEAKAMLSERDLPMELVSVIDLTNADSVKQSIDSIQKTWEKAVQKGVEERIKGSAPIEKAQGTYKTNAFENVESRYIRK